MPLADRKARGTCRWMDWREWQRSAARLTVLRCQPLPNPTTRRRLLPTAAAPSRTTTPSATPPGYKRMALFILVECLTRTVSGIKMLLTIQTTSSVCWKRFCFPNTSAISALDTLRRCALLHFTYLIDQLSFTVFMVPLTFQRYAQNLIDLLKL